MSVVVSITLSQGRRDTLVSLRNGFTYVSNLFTLIVAIIFILTIDNQIWAFRLLAYTLTLIGAPLSLYFIFFVPEASLVKDAVAYDKAYRKAHGAKTTEAEGEEKDENRKSTDEPVTVGQWLTNGAFYLHAGVYTFARMAVNVTMTLTPFYLIHVLDFDADPDKPAPPQIATVPLASYSFSMIFSLFAYRRLVTAFGNRLVPLLIGVIIT